MKTRVQKWGNSLALRIPKSFAQEVGLEDNTIVDISLTDGKLIVLPVLDHPPTLDSLLAQITDDNLHLETDFGMPSGNEVW